MKMIAINRQAARLYCTVVLALSAVQTHAASYTFTEVARPGAARTALWDINNSGTAVGYSLDGASLSSAFVYAAGSFTALAGPAGSVSANALGISDGGVVVGNYVTRHGFDVDGNLVLGPQLGYIYNAGTYTSYAVHGADRTELRGISPDGRYLTGYYTTPFETYAFVHDLVTNDMRHIGSGQSLFILAQGVTNGGFAVGNEYVVNPDSSLSRPGFTYDMATSTRTDWELPGTTRTALRAVDSAGTISGFVSTIDGRVRGITGFPGALNYVDFPGVDATFVEGSNDAGWLVGYHGRTVTNGFIAVPLAPPVPEPQTWALMSLGGVLTACVVRRRRATDPPRS